MHLISIILLLLTSTSIILGNDPLYVLEGSTLVNGSIPVCSYKTSTGIQIIIARTNGPLVRNYFCLATKGHDDNGIPHILEHLIFWGSEDYPYKLLFGQIADRMFSGINAFTAADRTCYTSQSVGKNASLGMIPIYLDHIFYPALTKSAFHTEVHHIDKEGKDGGVVYSEIRGDSLYTLPYAMIRSLYNGSGYDAYNGGALKNLRENATLEMVVDYHQKFYHPHNLCITIFGDVSIEDVMKSMNKIEKKILSKPIPSEWSRPWLTPIPTLKTTITNILLPSVSVYLPKVYIAWRGPNCVTEYRLFLACTALLSYVQKYAVGVSYYGYKEYAETALYLRFDGVEIGQIDFIYPKLQTAFRNITQGFRAIKIDVIKDIIKGKIDSFLGSLESSPFEVISNLIGNYFVYGRNVNDLKTVLNTVDELEYLLTVSDSYWIDLLKRYFVDKEYVQTTGVPSRVELDQLNELENERIEKRIHALGSDGLKMKGDELTEAIEMNRVPVPDSILSGVAQPNSNDIHFHKLNIYRIGDTSVLPIGLDLKSWPSYAEVYDCRTKFIYIIGTFFTHNIPTTLRPYLTLLLNLIKTKPIPSFVKSAKSLNDFTTVKTVARIGLSDSKSPFSCGSFSQTATFMIQVKRSEYEIGVQYFEARMRRTYFSSGRIRNAAKTLLNEVAKSHSDFAASTLDLLKSMNYDTDTNVRVNSVMYQKEFLTSILSGLKNTNTTKNIKYDLYRLRFILLSPSNFGVHVAADLNELKKMKTNLNDPWQRIKLRPGLKKLSVVSDWRVMNAAKDTKYQGEILGLDSCKVSYLYHTSPAVNDYNHIDLAPLHVALSYISSFQGPMHDRIRGAGYAYDCSLNLLPNEGQIRLLLYRASDPINAFKEFINIVNERTQTDAVWDPTLVDGAKGVTIYRAANGVSDIGDIPSFSLLSSFRNVSSDYHQKLIKKIAAVTIDDLKRVAQLYMTKILSTNETKTAIICSKDEANRIADGFKEFGFNLQVRQSWNDSALGQF